MGLFSAGLALLPLLLACTGAPSSTEGSGRTGGEMGAAAHPDALELAPGVLRPQDYGVQSWSNLHQRIRRNLASQLADEARIHQAEGQGPLALEDARRALEVTLQTSVPATSFQPDGPPPLHLEPDPRPLEERLAYHLESGWFDAVAFTWIGLVPTADDPRRIGSGQGGEPIVGVRLLLQARRALANGDPALGRALALQAAQVLRRATRSALEEARHHPPDPIETPAVQWLVGDPFRTSSPWGSSSPDFVLDRTLAYWDEAIHLAGPEAARDPAREGLLAEVERWRATLESDPKAWPRWTRARTLARVPT